MGKTKKTCRTCRSIKNCPIAVIGTTADKIEKCWRPRGSKHKNVKTRFKDIEFDSKWERDKYISLLQDEKEGKVSHIKIKPGFVLSAHNSQDAKEIGMFTPDFGFMRDEPYYDLCVLDTKSPDTKRDTAYRLRVKIFKANYPNITFIESVRDENGTVTEKEIKE